MPRRTVWRDQGISYISGDTTAGFKIGADIMPDGEYTFVHLVKYGAPRGQRIWQSSTNNFLIRVLER
jgi:hypothetical protein